MISDHGYDDGYDDYYDDIDDSIYYVDDGNHNDDDDDDFGVCDNVFLNEIKWKKIFFIYIFIYLFIHLSIYLFIYFTINLLFIKDDSFFFVYYQNTGFHRYCNILSDKKTVIFDK